MRMVKKQISSGFAAGQQWGSRQRSPLQVNNNRAKLQTSLQMAKNEQRSLANSKSMSLAASSTQSPKTAATRKQQSHVARKHTSTTALGTKRV